MAALRDPDGTSQTALYLSHVHDAGYTDHFQHAVVVVRLRELVLFFGPGPTKFGREMAALEQSRAKLYELLTPKDWRRSPSCTRNEKQQCN